MEQPKKVIDQDGRVFDSYAQAAQHCGIYSTCISRAIAKSGVYHNLDNSVILRPYSANGFGADYMHEEPKQATPQLSPVLRKIVERYSAKELEQLAKGEGMENKRLIYPEIRLSGTHHKIMVISDTHIGSVFAPREWHDVAAAKADELGVECVLHCGDLVDGLKRGRDSQIYEQYAYGYLAQKTAAIEMLSKYNKPVYLISGNHDEYFTELAGANICEDVANALPNVHYVGSNSADVEVGGVIVRLFHGRDGNSYALSYRLQKIIDAITGGKKPNILLAGHVHKFCYLLSRNVHAVSVPAMEMQTKFMEGKRLSAHTGFCVIDFDAVDGCVANFKIQLFPFYA